MVAKWSDIEGSSKTEKEEGQANLCPMENEDEEE